MKKILKTRAFVLQKYAFQESSFVCHCFSEDLGKVKFILRAATKKQSKLSNYQLGSILDLDTSYQQRGEWLKTYKNSSILEIIPSSYSSFCFLSFLLEFLFRSHFAENNSKKIFTAYWNFYQKINDEKQLLFYFLKIFTELIQIVGFYPRFEECLICKKKTYKIKQDEAVFRKEQYIFQKEQAGVICSQCHQKENTLSSAHIKIFYFFKANYEKIAIEKISPSLLADSFQTIFSGYNYFYPMQNFKSLAPLYKVLKIA
jgi:DNA repair protein RecO